MVAALLLLLGGCLRFRQLGTIPGVNGDEAENGARAAAHGALGSAATEYVGPYYVMALRGVVSALGETGAALRIVPAALSVLAPAVAFLALAPSLGIAASAAFALGLLIHPALLVFGRLGWDVCLVPIAFALALAAMRAAHLRSNSPFAGAVAAALIASACTFHPSGWAGSAAAAGCGAVILVSGIGEALRSRDFDRCRRLAVRALVLVVVFLLVASPVVGFVVTRLAHGGSTIAALSKPLQPVSWGELVTGLQAIRWITGRGPSSGPLVLGGSVVLVLLALAGFGLAMRSPRREERIPALFAALHVGCGLVAASRSDLSVPGNVRYVVGLYPSLLWLATRAPSLIAETWGPRTGRRLALVAYGALATAGAAGLIAYQRDFRQPLADEAAAAEPTFVPGSGADPKAAAAALILDRESAAQGPSAVIARDWHLFQCVRFFSGRRLPTIRLDALAQEEFLAQHHAMLAEKERFYLLVFERDPQENARLIDYFERHFPEKALIARDVIPSRAGTGIVSVYTFRRSS